MVSTNRHRTCLVNTYLHFSRGWLARANAKAQELFQQSASSHSLIVSPSHYISHSLHVFFTFQKIITTNLTDLLFIITIKFCLEKQVFRLVSYFELIAGITDLSANQTDWYYYWCDTHTYFFKIVFFFTAKIYFIYTFFLPFPSSFSSNSKLFFYFSPGSLT